VRYLRVWHDRLWKDIKVGKHRKYFFKIPVEGDVSYFHAIAIGWRKKQLEEVATLKILHDFHWWEYRPGKWHFRGDW